MKKFNFLLCLAFAISAIGFMGCAAESTAPSGEAGAAAAGAAAEGGAAADGSAAKADDGSGSH